MDEQDIELDLEGGDTGTTGSQSLIVRKNISLKLKGKGRGRGRLKSPRTKKAAAGYLKKATLDDGGEDIQNENVENSPSKCVAPDTCNSSIPSVVIEEDISKLEAPTFTTIDRGPPEPMHRNTKLKWDHRMTNDVCKASQVLEWKKVQCLYISQHVLLLLSGV